VRRTVLITGGAGFFGGILKARLLSLGHRVVSIDLQPDEVSHPGLLAVRGDLRNARLVESVFAAHRFDAVFHCAAILAHAVRSDELLWSSNVDATGILAAATSRYHVAKLVFISSNCLWADPFDRPVTEEDLPRPREIYGRSKWEAENILMAPGGGFAPVILRTPTIVASGRLGLLAMLFDFILEGRRVWVIGAGTNRYQFVYAPDLVDACIRAMEATVAGIFNVGSDRVETMRAVYESVIAHAGTGARVASLPRAPALTAMRLAHAVGVSPLGPYQYRMIAESFVFDTTKIKQVLRWSPTLTNSEMLFEAFDYYRQHRRELARPISRSAHRQPAPMGVVRVLKWMS
jgi:nucleoside-diphosphate-sugar epimerase